MTMTAPPAFRAGHRHPARLTPDLDGRWLAAAVDVLALGIGFVHREEEVEVKRELACSAPSRCYFTRSRPEQ